MSQREKAIIDLETQRDYANIIYVPELANGKFITFEVGDGEGLLPEDRADGYMSYVNWESYNVTIDGYSKPILDLYDEGCAMFMQPYDDVPMDEVVSAIIFENMAYKELDPEKAEVIFIESRRE